ncbi:hypothetical protein [Candidatus Laterigemmans baculatus]|uniref:hypothetical protein n=1 Tax=Candidatus Laterigemmans baculatus TaxID=2770505 RepID=UPI001F40253D|nr:hypothetical protein [Candidatus Laterigemmans baculatus]
MTDGSKAKASKAKVDVRRVILLVLALLAIGAGLLFSLVEGLESGRAFAAASMLRVGVVLFALWLALPSLRTPMAWLPPGLAALCLVAIMALAAQPKLILVLAPAAGMLLTLGWLVRSFRAARRR